MPNTQGAYSTGHKNCSFNDEIFARARPDDEIFKHRKPRFTFERILKQIIFIDIWKLELKSLRLLEC